MTTTFAMSVVICTRNRHEDLWRTLTSIARQTGMEKDEIEIWIVDDGDTDERWLSRARSLLPSTMHLRYYAKPREEAGLLRSRIKSLELSSHEILLFLDDDVELQKDYFQVLKTTWRTYPDAVGISGADQGFVCSPKGRALMLLSGRGAWSPGNLSRSGFASSMNTWNRQKTVFRTEFLHGCNMCYRKSALSGVECVDWLTGYSLGEDLYLSHLAGRQGPMYVNPELKLLHYGSPVSRDKEEAVAYTKVINHFRLLELRRKRGLWHIGMLLWTILFLYGEKRIQGNKEAAMGYRRGIRQLRSLLKEPPVTGRNKALAD